MLRNSNRPLFGNDRRHEDALTVQVSDANSNLGNLLLEADWEEALDYLATPEAQRDVDASNDPLGLFKGRSSTKIKHGEIPIGKNTAFFAALFVRAPYKVIEKIFSMAPSHVDQPSDLMYVVAVIPSEEEARLSSQQFQSKRIPYRTRWWSAHEYNQILILLLQSFMSSKSDPLPSLLNYWPSWIIGTSKITMTPLAIASYNPDVNADIVRILCALEPRAMKKKCTFFGGMQVIPLIVAAASPLPPKPKQPAGLDPKQSTGYDIAKNNRWEKVKLLTLSETWHDGQREQLFSKTFDSKEITQMENMLAAISPPTPTFQQIQHACEEAIRTNEWELVREFLKQYYPNTLTAKGESSMLGPIQTALAEHDQKVNAALERQKKSQEKADAREEWLHNNMGMVMYPIHTAMDLISAVIPASKKHGNASSGIVPPMS